VDGRSDIYSLGVLAFYALSGHFPFERNTPSAVLVAHVTTAPPALRDVAPHIPESVAAIVDRCLLKDPAERFEYAEELEEALIAAEHEVLSSTAPEILSATDAHAVWERAAYLQEMTGLDVKPPELPKRVARNDRPATLTSGYQMGDVRDAAKAVGIKDKYVDRALAERRAQDMPTFGIVPGSAAKKNPFLGDVTTLSFDAVIDGEMRERDFDLMIDIIRRTLGESGNVSAVGRSLHWTSTGQRKVQVSVLVRDGRTAINVSEKLRDLAGGLFGGIMGGGGGGTIGPAIGVGMGALHSPFAAVGLVIGMIGVCYTTARTIFTRIVRKRRETLQQLTEKLAEQARKSLAPLPLPGSRESRRLMR
jgi:serine/threonine-protein kinase